MTDKYQALREAAKKATPGPWESTEHGVGEFVVYRAGVVSDRLAIVFVDNDPRYRVGDMNQQDSDVAYIAAANPAAITALLADNDKLRNALQLSLSAMEHMGDVLNGMDAVEEEDEVATTPAFEAARAALAD